MEFTVHSRAPRRFSVTLWLHEFCMIGAHSFHRRLCIVLGRSGHLIPEKHVAETPD